MSLKEKCPIIYFPDLGDERGKLVVIEGNESESNAKELFKNANVPFEIKRVFYIYGSDSEVVRGQHANRESEFVLINVAGQSKVRITDGVEEIVVLLDKPMMGVYIPKMIWKDMYDFSSDSVLLVLASTHYDGTEYIRNYDEYLSLPEIKSVMDEDYKQPVLSLCMPTNGVPEWVFPSLDGIYSQGVEETLFEVVIMDNGNNNDFLKELQPYLNLHKNLLYYHTDKELFLSEPESYRVASGELIKFVNHRFIMEKGSIQYLIDFTVKNRDKKPVVYFSNGATRQGNSICDYDSFGEFVDALGYFSTWSGGMTVWKSDMDSIPSDERYNFLFPHTNILFCRRDGEKYIVDGTRLWTEVKQGRKPKGNYNVFYAFAVEYLYILLNLVRDGDISMDQFLSIKRDNLDFLSMLYFDYIVKKSYCSYDLTDYKKSLNTFYSDKQVAANCIPRLRKRILKKIKKILYKEG